MDKAQLQRFAPWLLAIASGVLGFLGYVGFDQFYLQWVYLAVLLVAIQDASPRRAFLIGWLMGTVGHTGGFYWVVHMLMVFAHLNLALSVVGLVAIAAINALSFGLFAWAVRRVHLDTGWAVAWIAPVIWVGIAHFFPYIFPFYLAASQYRLLPLTQIADVTGILGVTFMLVWCNAVLYEIYARRRSKRPFPTRPALAFGAALVMVLGYGALRIWQIDARVAQAPKLTAGLVQTNLGAADKHTNRRGFLQRHQEMSQEILQQQPLDLLVWPEGAYSGHLARPVERLTPSVLGPISTPIIFGALTTGRDAEGKRKRYNSVISAEEGRRALGVYDKRVLVPFGEYIPLGDTFPIIYKWSPYSGRYYQGESYAALPLLGYKFSANICYEDLFPGLVRDLMNRSADGDGVLPHALVNVTNDSWYGDTIEPMEHLVLASFRAIEHRRALLRSTNTGISAIVDPVGRLDVRSGQWTSEVVVGEVPMMSGQTLFGLLGNWFGWACFVGLLFCLGQAFWIRRQRGPAKDPLSEPPPRKPNKRKRSKRR